MSENLYTNKFWIDSNPNGILDSDEVLLVDLDSSTLDIFETAIRFGSSVTVGYETTFNEIVPSSIKSTAQSTIDGRFDKKTGELREFQYSATF